MLRPICILLIALLIPTAVGAQSSAPAQDPTPVGVWLHANKRIQVEIAPLRGPIVRKDSLVQMAQRR
jgi:hypothetical protein